MIIYYPWSEKVLNECLSRHDNGELTTLDLELTAQCTYASCIYCDSKPDVGRRHPNEMNFRETRELLKDAVKLGLRWIYACGLGEPLEDDRFNGLVEVASEYNVRLSIFTNGILIDEEKAKWLHDNKVCLILKLDTFKEEAFDRILGKKGAAKRIYNTVELLLDAGYGKNCGIDHKGNSYTDLAFSIVPTSLNIDDMDKVIKFAKENNIFPSVGELEQAGRVLEKKAYFNLTINSDTMLKLKQTVEKLLWKGYIRPICPAIITGLHIDHLGRCIVDKKTGLNCKWFLLTEPMTKEIGNIRKDDLVTMFEEVRDYRKKRFNMKNNGVSQCESIDYIFGGCGGNPRKIVEIARQHL